MRARRQLSRVSPWPALVYISVKGSLRSNRSPLFNREKDSGMVYATLPVDLYFNDPSSRILLLLLSFVTRRCLAAANSCYGIIGVFGAPRRHRHTSFVSDFRQMPAIRLIDRNVTCSYAKLKFTAEGHVGNGIESKLSNCKHTGNENIIVLLNINNSDNDNDYEINLAILHFRYFIK